MININMLRGFFRLLHYGLATFCLLMPVYLVIRRPVGRKSWLRSVPALLILAALLLFFYSRSSARLDINDAIDFHIIEDDFIYGKAIIDPPSAPIVSLKAGITVHIALALVFVGRDPHAAANAKDTITWLVVYSSAPIHFHIFTDSDSVEVVETMMKRAERQANCRFGYSVQTVNDIFDKLLDHLRIHVPHMKMPTIQEHVASQMLPLVLPWHLPDVHRLIFLSSRIKFRADVMELYEHFDRFQDGQVMGLTLTQGAKFSTAFAVYRHMQPGSHLGRSPPLGWPGFNTELMLLDLGRMRQSPLMTRYIDLENQLHLVKKYDFNGRNLLPALDEWLTLVGADKPQLFYTLPCHWNVQQVLDSDAFEYCRSDIKAMEFD